MDLDVETVGFPLAPDPFHLRDVGRTKQGNGFWITQQLASEGGSTRDFVAAYVFDKAGDLIFSEVADLGLRDQPKAIGANDIIEAMKRKIDAAEAAEIWVKPFAVSYYGYRFGLIVREPENDDDETVIDAMPGSTLMFYGPWSHCNYDS